MLLTPEIAICYAMLVSLAGAVVVLPFNRNKTLSGWLNVVITAVTSALALYAVAATLIHGPAGALTIFSLPGLDTSLRIYVDGLASVFIGLLAFIAFLSSLYSVRYMKHYEDYSSASYYAPFQLFLAGMYGILTVTDLFLFFGFFWQVMTLSSFLLIRYEYKKSSNVRAAWVYLLMMEIACGLVMAAGWMMSGLSADGMSLPAGQRFDIDRFAAVLGHIAGTSGAMPAIVVVSLVLALLGFAIKAGLWPFGQIWLPDAHPAAPSPVSALLSGVMIKTGVYGLIRIFLWMLPANAVFSCTAGWGAALAIVGTVTLFTGTVQALNQEESKRLLAYHSIGQVGYIVLAVGACLVLLPIASTADLAVIGLFGALFHTINHGFFKSLLFFNAGSMLYATGTQDLNKLGGLMKFMPLTAVTALVASFSISGVPLFNGFASKWSIYVSTILGGSPASSFGHASFLAVCGIFGVLTSVLTLASFVKFFGVSFLSRVSSVVSEKARKGPLEAGVMMQIPQVTLAVACILLGIFPAAAYGLFTMALSGGCSGLSGLLVLPQAGTSGLVTGLGIQNASAIFAPLAVLVVLALFFLLAMFIFRLGSPASRSGEAWLCGYDTEADHHRYKAHNLYLEVKHYLRWITSGRKRRDKE